MADPISVETLAAQPAFEVRTETKFWKIAKTLASGFATAEAEIQKAGAVRKDMPYARYLEIDWSTVHDGALKQIMEFLFKNQKVAIGWMVEEGTGSDGQAFGTEIPAGRYVATVHRGAYHEVGKTYKRMAEWAQDQGLELGDYSIEHYIDDPTEVEASQVRTQVYIPVAE